MYKTIVVALDGSPFAERVIPYVKVLANASKARVVLAQVVQTRLIADTERSWDELTAENNARVYLADLAAHLTPKPDVEVVRSTGSAAEGILNLTHRLNADLIAMSTHGRSGVGRWVFGSVADEVMRNADRPVLLVPRTSQIEWPSQGPLRIVVPLDGSDLAKSALGPAREMVSALGGQFVLVRVVDILPIDYTGGMANVGRDFDAELSEAQRYLNQAADELRATGATVTVRDVIGLSVTEITSIAREEHANLIAISTHGSGGLTRLVLGSVATGVIQLATTPVLVIPRAAALAIGVTAEATTGTSPVT